MFLRFALALAFFLAVWQSYVHSCSINSTLRTKYFGAVYASSLTLAFIYDYE